MYEDIGGCEGEIIGEFYYVRYLPVVNFIRRGCRSERGAQRGKPCRLHPFFPLLLYFVPLVVIMIGHME